MKQNKINIAVVQMNSNTDIRRNVDFLLSTFSRMEKLQNQPRLICTPENSLYMRVIEGSEIEFLKPDSAEFLELAKYCKDKKTNLHLGSVPVELSNGRFNSSILIKEDGTIEASYQKIHLFDIHLKDQKPIRESDAFKHGHQPASFEIDGWKFGQTICYDMRFSELYHHYQNTKVDVILVPAAFLVTTGRLHWEVLLRARAIENQSYVVAAAQSGLHQAEGKTGPGTSRRTFGHSLVVDPWGMVVYKNPAQIGCDLIELDSGRIEQMRTQIPMSNHRRPDIFKKS